MTKTIANRMILAAGVKLSLKSETVASAALYFYRFHEVRKSEAEDVYNPVTVAATCLYLAGKVEEEHLRLRDVINVFYSSVNSVKEPLELTDAYWSLRDSIVNCELLVMRVLGFNVVNDHPHRYTLHYLKSVSDWIDIQEDKTALARTCWSILNDFYTNRQCIAHPPEFVALSVINIALKLHDITVPCNGEAALEWNQALCEDLSAEKMSQITRDLLLTYKSCLTTT